MRIVEPVDNRNSSISAAGPGSGLAKNFVLPINRVSITPCLMRKLFPSTRPFGGTASSAVSKIRPRLGDRMAVELATIYCLRCGARLVERETTPAGIVDSFECGHRVSTKFLPDEGAVEIKVLE